MAILSYKNPAEYIKRAKALRKQAPMVERLLWNALCELRSETKIKFRRQHPLHPYIADFVCVKSKLIVELDGTSHDDSQAYDAERDAVLRSRGWTVLRFMNEDVENNLENVVLAIIEKAKALHTLP